MLSTAADTFRAWLLARRGETTQEALAADITATTGWHIARDRYSKYESGGTPIGAQVRRRFVDYWATKGGPSLEEFAAAAEKARAKPEPSEMQQLVSALREQAQAISALTARLDRLDGANHDDLLIHAVSAAVAQAVRTTLQASGVDVEAPGA